MEVRELLGALDAICKEHEGMDVDEFNNDVTYKRGINLVMGSS